MWMKLRRRSRPCTCCGRLHIGPLHGMRAVTHLLRPRAGMVIEDLRGHQVVVVLRGGLGDLGTALGELSRCRFRRTNDGDVAGCARMKSDILEDNEVAQISQV